jgi:hypothetical protein
MNNHNMTTNPVRPPYQQPNQSLPVGWTSAVDPTSKQVYYINNNVSPPQTSWVHPAQSQKAPAAVTPKAPPYATPPPYAAPVQQYPTQQYPVQQYAAPNQNYVAPAVAVAAVASQTPIMPGGPSQGGVYANVHAGGGGAPVGTVYAPVGNNGTTLSANTTGQVTASKWESVAVNDKVTLSGGVHAGTGGVGVSTGANVKVSDNASVWITPSGGASVSTQIGGMNVNIGTGGVNVGIGNLRLPLRKG